MTNNTIIRLMLVSAAALALSGCLTPEEIEAQRQAEMQEQLRLQAMIEAGECRERTMTGMRTRTIYECDEEGRADNSGARESLRRMRRQGGLCGGGNAACDPM
jgi:phosphoserine phosphatase